MLYALCYNDNTENLEINLMSDLKTGKMLFYELCVPCKISVLYKMLTGLDLTFSGGGAGGHKNAGRGAVVRGPGAGCGPPGRAELLNTVSSSTPPVPSSRPQQL